MAAVAWLALVACGPALAQAVSDEASPPALRLPSGARPTHYALTMTIVPGEAKAPGEMTIDIALDRPHSTLWLNADALAVSRVLVDGVEAHPRIDDRTDQFVGLALDPPLATGNHRLTLSFEADQNAHSARGLFTVKDGGAWYTLTQFEATSARRAFPCFDEPARKAPWQLTLRVPRELTAVANAPVVTEKDIGGDMKEVQFAETKPLPSYLVAFAVGPFDIVDAGAVMSSEGPPRAAHSAPSGGSEAAELRAWGGHRTPLRIIVAHGHAHDVEFAVHAFPQLLQAEERWFGIDYPFAKLDYLAIPLNVRFAMENAGLITYGAPILLAPRAATPPFRHGLANVAAHEMAHQWFGDLVTMAWWDDLWLNEAFANWFANKMVDGWQPGYEHGAAHVGERADAIEADSLSSARRIRQPIETRGDIANAFDSITYQKGATVIGMFEGWLGEDAFRRGVLDYLDAHRYASATADDFLGALSAASSRPVTPAFATFLDQNGVPQLRVDLDCSARPVQLSLAQHRHVAAGEMAGLQRWDIPVCARYGNGGTSHDACTLLTVPAAKLELPGDCPAFVFANAGARGYYIPEYSPSLLADLRLHRQVLTTAELASLVYDMRPLLRAGAVDVAQALDWVRVGAAADERSVVAAAIEVARFIRDVAVTPKTRPRFDRFVQHVFGRRARSLGFIARPGESDDDALLRRGLLRFAAAG
ncbi:MAG TPA: M1 family metallopeptidase, partial [Casimicrobiaceae bacterium]